MIPFHATSAQTDTLKTLQELLPATVAYDKELVVNEVRNCGG